VLGAFNIGSAHGPYLRRLDRIVASRSLCGFCADTCGQVTDHRFQHCDRPGRQCRMSTAGLLYDSARFALSTTDRVLTADSQYFSREEMMRPLTG
jgi:hypothetical protein